MNLTNNFRLMEFACKDGTRVPDEYMENVIELATQLQIIRDEIEEPVFINSAYRTPTHNKRLGGAPSSQHLTASAADVTCKSLTPKQLKVVVERLIKEKKIKIGGVGLYPGFLHVDIREGKARW